MGSMLRGFRRRQGTTGTGYRRTGRQDRPGAFKRAWLALTDPLRAPGAPGPALAPLGRFRQFGGPVPLPSGPYLAFRGEGSAAGDGTPAPSVPSAEDSSARTLQVVEAAETGWRLFKWLRKLWRKVKRGDRGV